MAPRPANTAAADGPRPGSSEAMRRKELARRLRLLLPALAAALAALLVTGRPAAAGLFGVATLLATRLLNNLSYPLSLMPVSRATVAAAGPLIAIGAIAAATGLGYGVVAPTHEAITIASAAMIVAILTDVGAAAWTARAPVRVAVLGSPDFAVGLRRELRENRVDGIEFVGWLNAGGELLDPGPAGRAAVERLRATISEHRIDLVVRGRAASGVPGAAYGGARPFEFAAEACVDLPVRLIDGAQFYEQSFGHVPLGMIDSAWYLFLMHPSYRSGGAAAKRAMDLIVGSLAALGALPLLALGALAIKLEDGGPILYRQRRVGAGGREFEIVKLRTMRADAEAGGARWCADGDRRVTRVGAILRRTHVDELAQLVNVLRGEMTLVGPRPERPEIVSMLEELFPHYRRRHLIKPGVTGWAQVRCGYAGSELGTAWKLCHDLFYLKHRSLISDLLIMMETVGIVAKDAHRPLRVPSEQFIFGPEAGLAEGGNQLAERPSVAPSKAGSLAA